MKKFIGWFFFKIFGWKFELTVPVNDIPKCVMIAAPHTSNWDFFYAIFGFWYMGIPMRFFIKDSYTKPWYGFIFRSLGAIGINRSQRSDMVGFASGLLKERDHLYILNTPEGTRSRVEKWKNGFYYIAQNAGVPIILAYCDYQKKIVGITKMIALEGKTQEEVLTEIQDYYKDIKGRHPENYNPKIF